MESLDNKTRELLRQISRAAFANPFGRERYELDAAIAELPPDHPEVVPAVIARLRTALSALPSDRPLDHGAADAALLEDAILFDAFHRFADVFDAHIQRERDANGPSPVFEGAADVERYLGQRGLPPARVHRAIELFWQLRRAYHFIATGLVGKSAPMRALRESLWSAIFTSDVRRYERHLWDRMEDFSTLVLGPTGSGKGAAAYAIGASGFVPFEAKARRFAMRFAEQLVPLNLAEVPGTLLESALFGHERGAFTGAIAKHEGALARCGAHATLFLDEIGEVPPSTQVKLLRVLQERSFAPLGSTKVARFEGRVVAATHRSLDVARREGRFRDDFYYRLCSHVVEVPTLAERLAADPGELAELVGVVVARIVGERERHLEALVLEVVARDLPRDYAWPGNVRELEQTVRRVLLTGATSPDPVRRDAPAPFAALAAQELPIPALLAGYCAELYARHGTYEKVAQITGLDRRTVKKHVVAARE